jgi:hypothetical protein
LVLRTSMIKKAAVGGVAFSALVSFCYYAADGSDFGSSWVIRLCSAPAFPGAMFAMVVTYGLGIPLSANPSTVLFIVYTVVFLFNLFFYITLFVFLSIVYQWLLRKINPLRSKQPM